jgi:hypothetical protein
MSKYNIFSKSDLVEFLEKHEKNYRFIDSPYNIMLDKKMNDVMKKLDINLERSKAANAAYEQSKGEIKYLVASKKLNSEWINLNKEYDRLSKLRFKEGLK